MRVDDMDIQPQTGALGIATHGPWHMGGANERGCALDVVPEWHGNTGHRLRYHIALVRNRRGRQCDAER